MYDANPASETGTRWASTVLPDRKVTVPGGTAPSTFATLASSRTGLREP